MVDVIRLRPDCVGAFERLHRTCEDGGWCACTAWWVPWAGFGERTAEQNAALRAELFGRGEYDGYLAMELLVGVLRDLPSRGALRVEAFPKRLKTKDPMDYWTGPESIFTKCGFEVTKDHRRHPILALDL